MSKKFMSLFVVAVLALPFSGCGKGEETKKTEGEASTEAAVVEITDTMLVSLVKADKLDGTEDKMIEKCYVCGLGMDGSEEHQAKIGDYTVCLCSEGCCTHFEEDAAEIVKTTEVPEMEMSDEG